MVVFRSGSGTRSGGAMNLANMLLGGCRPNGGHLRGLKLYDRSCVLYYSLPLLNSRTGQNSVTTHEQP